MAIQLDLCPTKPELTTSWFRLDGWNHRANIFPVVRVCGQDAHNIVGQACSFSHRICTVIHKIDTPCCCAIGPHDRLQAKAVTMCTAALDAVTLIAHEFVRTHKFDAQKRINRPATRVCRNPEDSIGAVSIEGIRRLNTKAAARPDGPGAMTYPPAIPVVRRFV